MTTTPNLGMTKLVENQASAEVTVNDFLAVLDALVPQPTVEDRDVTNPTALTPSDGEVWYINGTGAGDWTGHDNELAIYSAGWIFVSIREGMTMYVKDENVHLVYNGSSWVAV